MHFNAKFFLATAAKMPLAKLCEPRQKWEVTTCIIMGFELSLLAIFSLFQRLKSIIRSKRSAKLLIQ